MRESKAMRRPSGDQRGVPVVRSKEVSWTRFAPSLSHIQISKFPDRVDSKTILLPSGEYCGPWSKFVEAINLIGGLLRPFDCCSSILQMLVSNALRTY